MASRSQTSTTRRQRKSSLQENSIDLSTLVYGKVPPQALDAERAVLGAMMLEREAFDMVSTILQPETFYVDGHQRIYRAIQSLQQKNAPVDTITVMEHLRGTEELEIIGGPYELTVLTTAVVSSAHIVSHAYIIRDKYLARELIRIGGQLINNAYEDSVGIAELMEYAEESLLNIGGQSFQNEMVSIDDVLNDAMTRIEFWRTFDGNLTGVPTGFSILDRATRGWQKKDFIVLAARPSVGKSALMLKFLRAAVQTPKDCAGVWSLEMENVALVLRMLTRESKIGLNRIQTGSLDDNDMKTLYKDGVGPLAKNNIFFDDSSSVTIMSIRSKARRLKSKLRKQGKELRIIFVDYLQLMSGQGDDRNREQEVAKISRGLKNLAKELDIPVISLSQMSRGIENRAGPKREPNMSDMRESGAIEQDADLVMLLWGPDEEEIVKDGTLYGRRYVKIAKHRNGVLIKAELHFDGTVQDFTEYSHNSMDQHKTATGFKPVINGDLFDKNSPPPM